MKNIEFHYSIVYDFIYSLVRFIDESPEDTARQVYSDELTEKFKPDDNLTKWIKKTRCLFQTTSIETINQLFNDESRWQLLFLFYIRFRDMKNVPEFLNFIKELDAGQLVADYLAHYARHSAQFPDIIASDAQEMLTDSSQTLDYIEHVPFDSKRKWELLQYCHNPCELKEQLVSLLDWYWVNIFAAKEKSIICIINKQRKNLQQKLDKYGHEYLKLVLMGNSTKNKISLTISYFGELGYIILFGDDGEQFYFIGYRHIDVFVERNHGLLSNVLIFKALGDETRQNMIKLLAQKQWYGDELAQKMNLSNSTVSYHLSILILEGIVSLNRIDNRTYISLNKEHLKNSIEEALKRMI